MAIARKIAYNVFASSFSKVLSTVLALVSIGFITRYLGKEGFGEYATILAFLSFFAAISDLGLYHISTREISRKGAEEEKIIGNIFCLRFFSSIAVFLISPIIVTFFNYPIEVKYGIVIIASSFIFSSSYQILNGVFQKNLAMDRVAAGELIGKIIQVILIILAVNNNLGFYWVIASLLFNSFISFIIILIFSRKFIKFKLRFDLKYWKGFLKESMPMGIAAIITFFYFKMDTILLSVIKGSSEVGIYNAAYKVLENITFFPSMVVGLVLPIMSASIFDERLKFEKIADKTFNFFFLLTVPLIIGTLFLSEGVIDIIGGSDFSDSAGVLRILIFALALIFFGHFFNTILIVSNLQKNLMVVLGIAAAVNISLNLIFIPKFSYIACAYTSVITELFVVALTSLVVFKKVNYLPKIKKTGSVLLSGFLMALFLFLFRSGNFAILFLGSILVYFSSLWFFKAVETSEILSLISKKSIEEYEELP